MSVFLANAVFVQLENIFFPNKDQVCASIAMGSVGCSSTSSETSVETSYSVLALKRESSEQY